MSTQADPDTLTSAVGDAPLRVAVEGPVAVVTLDDPRRRNPLSVATMRGLLGVLRALADRTDVHVIILRAQGPAFSAGHDLSELTGRTLEEERAVFALCSELMLAVHAVPQPVIASVQGTAVAAGCQLVATCDLAVAAEGAVFGTPGVKIGLFCSTPMVAISRAIGRKRAMQLLLTGETIDAVTAADWGLINTVVPAERLEAATAELAAAVANASSQTLAIGKEAYYRQIDLGEADAYAAMGETMATNAMTRDAQEGISAFLAKRPPTWTGR